MSTTRYHRPIRRLLLPAGVMLVCLTAGLVLWFVLEADEEDSRQRAFQSRAMYMRHQIDERLMALEQAMRGGSALLTIQPGLTDEQWNRYVDGLQLSTLTHLGASGLGVMTRVTQDQKKAFLAERRRSIPEFRIWPAGQRPLYFPLKMLRDIGLRPSIKPPVGFDAYSEPVRRDLLERAVAQRKLLYSPPITLNIMDAKTGAPMQEKEPAVVAYMPIFRVPDRALPARHDENVLGIVVTALRFRQLLGGLREPGEKLSAAMLVPGIPPVLDAPSPSAAASILHQMEFPLTYGGGWRLRVQALSGYDAGHHVIHGGQILSVAGTAGAILAVGLFVMQRRQHATIVGLERVAERNRRRFRELARSAPFIILLTDRQGRPVFFNPAWREFTGRNRSEDESFDWPTCIHPADLAGFEACLQGVRTGQAGFQHEARLKHHDGQYRWMSMQFTPTFDPRSAPDGFVGVLTDIHARKQAEALLQGDNAALEVIVAQRTAELVAAKNAAEAASRAKSEFLSNMSHELKTPMHAMLSFSALGLEATGKGQPDAAKLNRFFDRIAHNGKRLLELLNDLLDLAKLEAGHMQYTFRRHDLRTLARQVVDTLSAQARQKNLVLRVEAPETPVSAESDADRMMQVMTHLLENAIKYSPHDGTVRIVLSEADQGGSDPHVCIDVVDEGIGIPAAELEAVFDKFTQSTQTRTGAGGVGLGLAICRQIVRNHGGRIWAENNPGQGATFRLRFPSGRPRSAEPRPAPHTTPEIA